MVCHARSCALPRKNNARKPICGQFFSIFDQRTLPEKFGDLIESLDIGESFTLVADAYYACGHMAMRPLLRGCHLSLDESAARRNGFAGHHTLTVTTGGSSPK